MRHERFPTTPRLGLEELLFYMPACAKAATNEWARDFAHDMTKRTKWRNWRPTPKQEAIMRRMVAELFAQDDDGPLLIED